MPHKVEEKLRWLEGRLGGGKKVVAYPRSLRPAVISPEQLEILKTAEAELKDSLFMVYEADMPLELSRKEEDMAETFKKLTPEEERIIVHKGTEPPGSGKYNKFYEKGAYRCKRCGTQLFKSDAKFDSGSGWPSFDQAIPGRVKEVPDADGMRTEIVCANCGAHLGHVFRGEKMTPANTRHCVNSLSLDFEPSVEAKK